MDLFDLQRAKIPALPARIEGLAALACNLAWSWHRQSRAIFRRVDPVIWRRSAHNPITLLREVTPARLEALLHDNDFLAHYDEVMSWFTVERTAEGGWFRDQWPDLGTDRPVAYFCAEFGLHASVPIYSGGLGVLAGDHCKTASDLAVPFVGVGLFYKKGYFDQQVSPVGWQEDGDDEVDPILTPLVRIPGADGAAWVTVLETFGRPVHIAVWTMTVGRAPIYLLDTDLEENAPEDRGLTSKLYSGGLPMRLRQEWVLGVGGTQVLAALGVTPGAWHANEGHAAFMMLERVRQRVMAGVEFDAAVSEVRRTTLFTTHTPVPAGHDHFNLESVIECAGAAWLASFGIGLDRVLSLGVHAARGLDQFHMTVLAIRCAGHVNGVAQRHGIVSREIWGDLWHNRAPEQVPIGAVTNGVHLPTWMANPIKRLLDRHLGRGWVARRDEAETWDAVLGLDSHMLWAEHQALKQALLHHVREDARRRWGETWTEAAQVVASGTLLDPNVLTIGFARRFATYKRADLLFRDTERLRRMLTDQQQPVQLVLAGKAHPQDNPGKEVLQAIHYFTRDPMFEGRVAFLEDYDMHLAHLLVQGVDLWLNVPRVPLEASGTSGMKAALNGVPHLSTLDGWWEEGASGRNGWTIPRSMAATEEEVDAEDAEALYRILEQEVIPMWYHRDDDGVPQGWVMRMKESIRVAGKQFAARRMLQDYARQYYAPILRGDPFTDDPPTG
ncbi:MAG TPA: alpha-glucan family phosphorylase [Gemmatimonadales bacterium]|nr:alpha-glucan family phosphorylase [Gemmatimonadales bacterium]